MSTSTDQPAAGNRILAVCVGVNLAIGLGLVVLLWWCRHLAADHALAPNTVIGFRSQATLSSATAWFEAQKAGFGVASVGATLALLVAAAVLGILWRRGASPVTVSLVAALPVLLIAGAVLVGARYAEDAAGAAVGAQPTLGPWPTPVTDP